MGKQASSIRHITYFITIALTIISCSRGGSDVAVPEDVAALENVSVYSDEMEPLNEITFTEEASFGDTDSIFISRVSGVAVTDDGTLFLADRSESVIHVYSGSGEYQRSIGREGEGPGEFQNIVQPQLRNGMLFVYDLDQLRMSLFDANDFTFQRAFTVGDKDGIDGRPNQLNLLSDERILALYSGSEREGNRLKLTEKAAILDDEGEVISSGFLALKENNRLLMESNGMFQIFSMPFLGQNLLDVTANDEIVTGFTDRFLLHYLSLEGDTLRSVYHATTPPPLDRQAILNNMTSEAIRSELSAMDLPETRQAFNSLTVDDENRLWVSSPTEDTDINEWRVLSADGEKLAQFERPSSSSLELVKDGYVYFLETDEETGITEVVKYNFRLN